MAKAKPQRQTEIRVFGVRHHGPGFARALVSALMDYRPDLILLEGPPEGEAILPLAADPQMKPPVAMLVYDSAQVKDAAFYPFASFSPEWVAIRYAARADVKLNFFDLEKAVSIALEREEQKNAELESPGQDENDEANDGESNEESGENEKNEPQEVDERLALAAEILADPLGALARRAGDPDPNTWEERAIEQAPEPGDVFPAILTAATELRATVRSILGEVSNEEFPEQPTRKDWARKIMRVSGGGDSLEEALREASMRRRVREAVKSGAERIAVVCGAWHAPVVDVLTEDPVRSSLIPAKKDDDALLAKLPKIKTITSTWLPWTYDRLARKSGYGAGVEAPGWLETLWIYSQEAKTLEEFCGTGLRPTSAIADDEVEDPSGTSAQNELPISRWTARTARLLRGSGFESLSCAEAIDAARLALALANLRGRATPSLTDARDAILCVFAKCQVEPLTLVHDRLEVGTALGSIPDSAPTVPLERDFNATVKSLRLTLSPLAKTIDLDLRNERDRAKSAFFRRARFLKIPWASETESQTRSLGTFRETWEIKWDPENAVSLIEASRYGATIFDAASAAAIDALENAKGLAAILELFRQTVDADLSDAACDAIFERLNLDAAYVADLDEFLGALPPLVQLLRYGDARKTDKTRLESLFDSLFERMLVKLPGSCSALDEDAAEARCGLMEDADSAILQLNIAERKEELNAGWKALIEDDATAPLISGRLTRLLMDREDLDEPQVEKFFAFFVSPTSKPTEVALWLQGFLKGEGQTLLWRDKIWSTFDRWLSEISAETFEELVPLLRRAFADFTGAERREMGKIVAKLAKNENEKKDVKEENGEDAPGVEEEKAETEAVPEDQKESAEQLQSFLSFIMNG